MLSLISFILVCIGAANWFTIGVLQYDFVAGLFGSQSNIFSRIIYALVGIASIIVVFNLIKNKGKFIISFKKTDEEYEAYKEKEHRTALAKANVEAAKDHTYSTSKSHETSTNSSETDKKDM